MKKNIKVLLSALLCTLLVFSLAACKNNVVNPTDPETQTRPTINSTTDQTVEPTTEPTPSTTVPKIELPEQVSDIPGIMFEDTLGREFDFSLINPVSQESWELTPATTYETMEHAFMDPLAEDELSKQLLKPEEIGLKVMYANDTNGIFLFGVVNNSDEEAKFNHSRVVYVSYSGNDPWYLCGLRTGLNKDEAIAAIGSPTQSMSTARGYVMEWYVYNDGHAYIISAELDSENGKISTISVNIDNYPVFAGNTSD